MPLRTWAVTTVAWGTAHRGYRKEHTMTVIRVVVMRLTVPGDTGRSARRVDTPRDTNGLHRQTRPVGRDRAAWLTACRAFLDRGYPLGSEVAKVLV